MIISISQPTLFPWLGYFDIIKKSDIFVFLDNVKFEKRSWQMRNKLKTISNNEEKEIWIRIPTKCVTSDTKINEVKIDNSQNWKNKHINSFTENYGKTFREIEFINEIYNQEWEKLSEFNIKFISECCKYLEIKTPLKKASELNTYGKKSNLLLEICKKFNAKKYFSTVGSKEYLDKDKEIFDLSKIDIIYHEFKHPMYLQKGRNFISHLSVLDLLFNEKINAKKFF